MIYLNNQGPSVLVFDFVVVYLILYDTSIQIIIDFRDILTSPVAVEKGNWKIEKTKVTSPV
jgi:hypothetical protein